MFGKGSTIKTLEDLVKAMNRNNNNSAISYELNEDSIITYYFNEPVSRIIEVFRCNE